MGMCGPKGYILYGFSAILVINGVLILASLAINRALLLHSSLELFMFFRRSYFLIIQLLIRPSTKAFHILPLQSKRPKAFCLSND